MRVRPALVAIALAGLSVSAQAQTRPPPARRPTTPPRPAVTKVAPEMRCPALLGLGVVSKGWPGGREFCDVLSGRSPVEGVIITLPPHRGDVTLTFDLHNRHTYSEEQVKANRAYARYTAVIGALTMDNTLISRAAIQSEFRNAGDLVDLISGGAGPSGVKAVAPTGTEHITIMIPAAEKQVSLLGEKVTIDRPEDSATYSSAGRPIAVISNVMIEYRPVPPRRAPRKSGQ